MKRLLLSLLAGTATISVECDRAANILNIEVCLLPRYTFLFIVLVRIALLTNVGEGSIWTRILFSLGWR